MRVSFYATLRPIVGGKTIDVPAEPGITVRRLVDELVERYPRLRPQLLDEHGKLWDYVHVFVNGRDAPYLEYGLDTRISPDDKLDIFPPVAGGSQRVP